FSTLTVTFGYLVLKSAFTPSTTLFGALPFISHTVRVPVSLAGLLLTGEGFPPHAAATSATATVTTLNHVFLRFIQAISPCFLNAAPQRQVIGRLHCPAPRQASCAGRRPSARCGFAAVRGRRPGDIGRRGRWSGRTRRSALTRRRSSARREMPGCGVGPRGPRTRPRWSRSALWIGCPKRR